MKKSVTEVRTVSGLRHRLACIENERRFNGRPYPAGRCPVPREWVGRGFFPGGDGLWRPFDQIHQPSHGNVSVSGVMFLGNDFGTVSGFQKGPRSVPTWRHLKRRIEESGIPVELAFFTNAIMGLREKGTALKNINYQRDEPFLEFCLEFLEVQLDYLNPRLVVTLGKPAAMVFARLESVRPRTYEVFSSRLVQLTHPYGDFGLSNERLISEIAKLKNAWNSAQVNAQ